MIKSIEEREVREIEIDLTGPDGNAFVLMGIAGDLAKQLGYDADEIIEEMQESDYDNLLGVMEKYFGDYITMYR